MEKIQHRWGLLLTVLLVVFLFFGMKYRQGEKGGFPFCTAVTAWVEEKWGVLWES